MNEKYREWAKSNYKDIEAAVVRAEQIRELERQVAEYKRLHGPPMTLPDGTPITAENKENETTYAYFRDKIYDPNKHTGAVYTAYYSWAEDTYGMTKWRKLVVQADQVTQAFVGGLIKSTVMGVVDTAKFAFDFVIDPEKTTQETIDKVNYLVSHPEVLVDAAKAMYHDFNEGTPEQKAEMLGNAASILVPGVPIAKTGVVGKVADAVMDPLTDAVKKVPDALKHWNFPGTNPYPNRLNPATPGGPGPIELPGQVWRSEGRGKAEVKEVIAPSTGKPIKVYTDGNTTIPIDKIEKYMRGKVNVNIQELSKELRELKQLRQTQRKVFDADPQNAERIKRLESMKHNYERSDDMRKKLESIGLNDTPESNQSISKHLLDVGKNITPENRLDFPSVLEGPNGRVKVLTTWSIVEGKPYLSTIKLIPIKD
ncbi:hypothetical protein NSU18_08945 [Paenibacillus sp. FSL H8-0048]|uniref:hypothetical protein n=1 Tax=Paenibacillus sp. FSL H8-0048 TaxID=2954508 RepID=UPI0030F81DDA